jgi:hypothetical protein
VKKKNLEKSHGYKNEKCSFKKNLVHSQA